MDATGNMSTRKIKEMSFEEFLQEYTADLDVWNISDADYRKIKESAKKMFSRIIADRKNFR